PMYLSPLLAVPTSLSPAVEQGLAKALHRIEAEDDVTSVSADLASRFPPPDCENPAGELGLMLSGRACRGLFGNSEVGVKETPAPVAAAILSERDAKPTITDTASGAKAS